MRKSVKVIGGILAGITLLGVIASGANESSIDNAQTQQIESVSETVEPDIRPTCDGTAVTENCTLDDINYATYVYHPAVPEKTRTETITTYEREVTSYCTLCNDGTYSPSCATGRGACSHHGGVAKWNAPRYSNVAKQSTKTVVDAPAQEAYYEKVIE